MEYAKLQGASNYHEWQIDIEMLLRSHELYGFITDIEGNKKILSSSSAPIKGVLEYNQDKALSMIYLSLSPQVKPIVNDLGNPRAVWKRLEANFEPSSKAMIGRLLTEFFLAIMVEDENISLYIPRLRDLQQLLVNAKCDIKDLYLAYKMISGLPERYNVIIQQLYQLPDVQFTSDAVAMALLAEKGRQHHISKIIENIGFTVSE